MEGPVIDLASMSYNDSTLTKKKRESEFRVLSFGDSFAFSITKYPFSYHGVAAEILNEHSRGRSVRVVNLGEPAASFYQYIKGYAYWGRVFEHDAVVFNIYLGNDVLDVSNKWVPKDAELNRLFGRGTINFATGRPMNYRIPRRYPFRFMDYLYAQYLEATGQVKIYKPDGIDDDRYNRAYIINAAEKLMQINKKQLENFDPDSITNLEEGYKGFLELALYAKDVRQGCKEVLFMLSPNVTQVDPLFRKRLENNYDSDYDRYDFGLSAYLMTEAIRLIDPEIQVLNLIGSFSCSAESGQALYPDNNTHWSVEGNRLAGENLAWTISNTWLREDIHPLHGLQECVNDTDDVEVTDEMILARSRMLNEFVHPLVEELIARR